jgi:hypothetical protein
MTPVLLLDGVPRHHGVRRGRPHLWVDCLKTGQRTLAVSCRSVQVFTHLTLLFRLHGNEHKSNLAHAG